jgi:hypothetical protein
MPFLPRRTRTSLLAGDPKSQPDTGNAANAYFVRASVSRTLGDWDQARDDAQHAASLWSTVQDKGVLAYHRKAHRAEPSPLARSRRPPIAACRAARARQRQSFRPFEKIIPGFFHFSKIGGINRDGVHSKWAWWLLGICSRMTVCW